MQDIPFTDEDVNPTDYACIHCTAPLDPDNESKPPHDTPFGTYLTCAYCGEESNPKALAREWKDRLDSLHYQKIKFLGHELGTFVGGLKHGPTLSVGVWFFAHDDPDARTLSMFVDPLSPPKVPREFPVPLQDTLDAKFGGIEPMPLDSGYIGAYFEALDADVNPRGAHTMEAIWHDVPLVWVDLLDNTYRFNPRALRDAPRALSVLNILIAYTGLELAGPTHE